MAALKYKDRSYRTIAEILNSLGFRREDGKEYEGYMRGGYVVKDGKYGIDSIAFFHAPIKYKDQYGWTTNGNNEKWLNVPLDENWSSFTHIKLIEDEQSSENVNEIVEEFSEQHIADRKMAIFIREKDNYYYFLGVYKSEYANERAGICVYWRIEDDLKE